MKKIITVTNLIEVANILNNVHPDSVVRARDGVVYIRGYRLYADIDGVYNEIEVHNTGLDGAGVIWWSIRTFLDYVISLLNR